MKIHKRGLLNLMNNQSYRKDKVSKNTNPLIADNKLSC